MIDITTGDALAEIKRQLDWRGPTDKVMGNIVLDRPTAEFLHARVLELVRQQDVHIARIEALQRSPDSEKANTGPPTSEMVAPVANAPPADGERKYGFRR
jgi:hypothetical protein